ncbi:4Fe-4S binding protein [Candidatus Acetothermia bacterium]|nr:4Fe-4S binding protein [Candidatus Acetothermia bacterium]
MEVFNEHRTEREAIFSAGPRRDAQERCVGCLACMEVCPSQAILVVPGDNPTDKPVSKAKKYSVDFQINYLRCIFDGACEEACPVDAIILSTDYELGGYSREELIYRKDKLNEPHPGASGIDVNWSRRPAPAPKPATPAAPTAPATPKPAAPSAPPSAPVASMPTTAPKPPTPTTPPTAASAPTAPAVKPATPAPPLTQPAAPGAATPQPQTPPASGEKPQA